MIRIKIHESGNEMTFQLEGRLAGAFVRELEQCWKASEKRRGISRVAIDLRSVTGVDDAGRYLLRLLIRDGATFVGPPLLMHDILEISESPQN
jgi:ABC-type transporter Mla MlaB component